MPRPRSAKPPLPLGRHLEAAASVSTWAPATANARRWWRAGASSATKSPGIPARSPTRSTTSTASTIPCGAPPRTCRAWTPSAAAPRACTSTTGARRLALPRRAARRCSIAVYAACSSTCRRAWGGIPFEVVNDGEVTALAGSMALGDNAVLGVAMGSSLAAGYVTPRGAITGWLNELAFVPWIIARRAGGRMVGRSAAWARNIFRSRPWAGCWRPPGIDLAADMPLPVKLEQVQQLAAAGDARALRIYETIGVWFGYTIAHLRGFLRSPQLAGAGPRDDWRGRRPLLAMARAVLAGRVSRSSPSASASTFRTSRRNGTARPSPPPACPPFRL